MAQLAQAYLHLKPYTTSARKINELGRILEVLSADAAKRIYDGGVSIDLELEEGSLIVRVTVVGLLTAHLALDVYSKVADYKGFKESTIELCDDAKKFAVDVCAPFREKAGASEDQVYRFERRLKTPGKLKRIVSRLAKLERAVGDLSPNDLKRELSALGSELSKVSEDLTIKEMDAILPNITPKNLPPPSQWPKAYAELPKVAKKEEQLGLDQEFGPARIPSPSLSEQNHPRTIYRKRIRVDPQLPGLSPSTKESDRLDFGGDVRDP